MSQLCCGPILICLFVLHASPTNLSFDGIWQSEGYGDFYEIQGLHIKSFQVTTTTCVKGPPAHFVTAEGTAKSSEGDLFTIRNSESPDYKLLHPIGSLGEIRLDRVSRLPAVCSHLTPNSPADNFEVFARSFAEHYISLDLKHVDWDAITESARSTITPTTSPKKLFEIMKDLIGPFADGHTGIEAHSIHREFEGFVLGATSSTKTKLKETSRKIRCPFYGA